MDNFQTDQEHFWAGNFGDEYTERNQNAQMLASNIALFSKIVSNTQGINSIIEFGSNIGLNLRALQTVLPDSELAAIEINDVAVNQLKKIRNIHVHHESILNFQPAQLYDFVLIKGVLIHLNPDCLESVYKKLYKSSCKYICVAEYYNPSPVEIKYRGHEGKLFKRDFAGELMAQYSDLKLIDYGFAYHRDPVFPQDDITWFLLEKK